MKKTFSIILLIALTIGLAVFLFITFATYSEGTRAGQVIKVSKKGVFFKTWEGQLNLQSFGAIKSSNSLAEVFNFSIEKGDTNTYNMLQKVSLTGERVNLHYEQKYAVLPWEGDSKFFIVKIDRVENTNSNGDKKQKEDPYREGR